MSNMYLPHDKKEDTKYITVKELKEKLSEFPDDMMVKFRFLDLILINPKVVTKRTCIWDKSDTGFVEIVVLSEKELK